MKNLKWILEANQYVLKNDDSSLVEAVVNVTGISQFRIGNKIYQVQRKGCFNPVYSVESGGVQVLKLVNSFWSGKGTIYIHDNPEYACMFTTRKGIKMQVMEGEHEILSYYTSSASVYTLPVFSVGIFLEDGEKLLILAAFGLIIFQSLFSSQMSDGDVLLMTSAASGC